ncbi:hypothetical protein EYF80_042224 [Liparis tanakae]|uniref:Uncharacterized protein n=1 Tax=Liparis tanakae TaxID=230148 RepID=A0A4Z2G4T5_9TELE|nr:hypothetical protein EYF80_042224 [Liparis tanakae]
MRSARPDSSTSQVSQVSCGRALDPGPPLTVLLALTMKGLLMRSRMLGEVGETGESEGGEAEW